MDVQQRLLGFCVRALEDTPILPSGVLNQHGPESTTFRPQETVDLVCDPLSLQDLHLLLDLFKPSLPFIVGYVARMVPIDSDVSLIDARAVQTRAFEMAGGPA